MILLGAILSYTAGACRPRRRTGRNISGNWLGLRPPPSQLGKHWRWSGPSPHATAMHYYGQLSPVVKATWQAYSSGFTTNEPDGSALRLNGAVVWQIINRNRKAIGNPTSDSPPATSPIVPNSTGTIAAGRSGRPPVALFLTDDGGAYADHEWIRTLYYQPATCGRPALKYFQPFGTFSTAGPHVLDVTDRYGNRFGAPPAGSFQATLSLGFMADDRTNMGYSYAYTDNGP